jgi:hypothetical protein
MTMPTTTSNNFQTITVGSHYPATQLVYDEGIQVQLLNLDPVNVVYLGGDNAIEAGDLAHTIPLAPGGSYIAGGNIPVFGITLTNQTVAVGRAPDAVNFTIPPSLIGLGGIKVFVQPLAPTGTIPVNSLWLNTTLNALESWNGAAWVIEAFNGSELITAGTISANLIVANFFQGFEIDGAIFRAKNTFGATIMTINKSNGTWILYQDLGSATQGMVTASGNNALTTTIDEFLNEILQGVTAYGGSTTQWSAVNMTGASTNGALAYYSSTAATQTGFALQTEIGFITGASTAISNNGLGFAFAIGDLVTNGVGTLSACATQAVSVNTVVATSFQTLASATAFTAGDPQLGSTYELEVWGAVTQGTTSEALNLGLFLGGTQIGGTATFGPAQWTVSQALRWHARLTIKLAASPGSGATWWGVMVGTINETGANLSPGTVGQSAVAFTESNTGAVAKSSAVAQTLEIRAFWTSATGAPTISAIAGNLKKIA